MSKHMSNELNMLNMVYSGIKIDEELNTRMCILKMMYSVVEPLSDSVIYCEQDDNVTIVNKTGIEIASGSKDTLKLLGIFLAIHDNINNNTTIYCFSTNKKKVIANKSSLSFFNLKPVGEEFVQVEFSSRCIILNKHLESIFDIDTYRVNTYIQGESKICIRYVVDMYRGSVGYINRLTGRIESYDYFDLNENFGLLATEYHRDKGIAVNKDCIQYFKYKLVKNGVIVSKKSYEDITKPSELTNTDTFYTFEIDKDRIACSKKGLIRSDGTELLSNDYDEILYVGANNYLLKILKDSVGYAAVYNSEKGVVYNFNELINAVVHKTLPLVILQLKDGRFTLLGSNGEEFSPEELSKHFRCSYSKSRPDLIRIELNYGKRYITNRLVPITNMHEISRLSTHEWIPM